jgi:hypothetical protein
MGLRVRILSGIFIFFSVSPYEYRPDALLLPHPYFIRRYAVSGSVVSSERQNLMRNV